MNRYRLYTEDVGREHIKWCVDAFFDNYTLLPGVGCYKGKEEKCLIVERITPANEYRDFVAIAEKIKELNKQESVLITFEDNIIGRFI